MARLLCTFHSIPHVCKAASSSLLEVVAVTTRYHCVPPPSFPSAPLALRFRFTEGPFIRNESVGEALLLCVEKRGLTVQDFEFDINTTGSATGTGIVCVHVCMHVHVCISLSLSLCVYVSACVFMYAQYHFWQYTCSIQYFMLSLFQMVCVLCVRVLKGHRTIYCMCTYKPLTVILSMHMNPMHHRPSIIVKEPYV